MSASSQRTWLGALLFLAVASGIGWWAYQQYFAIDTRRVNELTDRGLEHIEKFEFANAVEVLQEAVKIAPKWEPAVTALKDALTARDTNVDMTEIAELNNRGIARMEHFDDGEGYSKAVPI